jgi:hypothetical protein
LFHAFDWLRVDGNVAFLVALELDFGALLNIPKWF